MVNPDDAFVIGGGRAALQAIDYELTANRAVLDAASRYRETLLFNMYRMGKNSIERGSRDTWTMTPHHRSLELQSRAARGYILRADQPDFLTATKFVRTRQSWKIDPGE